MQIPGLKNIALKNTPDLIELPTGGDGLWKSGHDGVVAIFTMLDKKVDFIVFKDKTLVYIKSAMGYPAIYELKDDVFEGPAEYVLMDLDGTSVHSEAFWIWIIEQTTAALLGNPKFTLEHADEPFVSGHSVSEHLQHCIKKYCPDKTVEEARNHYFRITNFEMNEIMQGRGRDNAFTPAPGLRDFLLELKSNKIKIGLVTSGLYEKAWPEVLSAFRTLKMGDPLDFYDAIITAGYSVKKGQAGTLGELSPKPHPWLYAETARVGLGVPPEKRHRVIGLEDSSAGVLSIRLAGFSAVGLSGGNIEQSGARPLLRHYGESLTDILPVILGKNQ